MRLFKAILSGFGGIAAVVILLDLPEMGGVFTALRLILLLLSVGLVWGIGKGLVSLLRNREYRQSNIRSEKTEG